MGKPWFAPKRTGYGSSLPICWQGWTVVLVCLLVLLLAQYEIYSHFRWPERRWWMIAATLAIFTPFLLIVHAKTEGGGWRRRSGKD